MADATAIAKTARENHAAQIQRLTAKNQDELQLLEELREYLKRRAEIESTYQEQLSKLAMQFLASRKKSTKHNAAGEERKSRTQARIRANFAERLKEQFAGPLKPYITEKMRLFTRYAEYAQRVQTDLHVTYAELARLKQLYDQCAKEEEKAQNKYDDAIKPSTGTFKRIIGGQMTQEKLEQTRKRLKAATRKTNDAKNEYLLVLEAANSHQHYYHHVVLPQLMRSMDGVYYDELKRLLTEFGDLESANARDSAAAMAAVVTAASRINRDIESDDFLSEHSSVFEEPRPFTPELLGNNTALQTSEIIVNELTKVPLSNKLAMLQSRIAKLAQAIEKKDKEIEGLVRMTAVYEGTPQFGKASETKEQVDVLQHNRDMMSLEKVKLEAQVAMLTKAGVEVLNPVVAVKKPKKAAASASQPKLQCVALYDYQANDSEELSFQKDDVITILEDRPEWLLGSLNGQTGLVPVTYVAKRVAPLGSESTLADTASVTGSGLTLNKSGGKALALYHYKGSEADGELSFQAGDTIEIISRGSPDDPDFWEGRLNGKTGYFPRQLVDVLDEDDSASVSDYSTIRRSASSSTVNSVVSQLSSTQVPGHEATAAAAHTAAASYAPPPARPAPPPQQESSLYVLALYDYAAQADGELTFNAGDLIQVVSKETGDPEWWIGRGPSGVTGQFPRLYVDVAPQPPPQPKPAAPTKTKTAKSSRPPPPGGSKKKAAASAAATAATAAAAAAALPKAKVLYDYDAASSDELTIRADQVVEIVSKEVPDDPSNAWWLARLDGREGVIPKDYVSVL